MHSKYSMWLQIENMLCKKSVLASAYVAHLQKILCMFVCLQIIISYHMYICVEKCNQHLFEFIRFVWRYPVHLYLKHHCYHINTIFLSLSLLYTAWFKLFSRGHHFLVHFPLSLPIWPQCKAQFYLSALSFTTRHKLIQLLIPQFVRFHFTQYLPFMRWWSYNWMLFNELDPFITYE